MDPPGVEARELVAGQNEGQHDVGPPGAVLGLGVPGVADGFHEVGISLSCVAGPPNVGEGGKLVAGKNPAAGPGYL